MLTDLSKLPLKSPAQVLVIATLLAVMVIGGCMSTNPLQPSRPAKPAPAAEHLTLIGNKIYHNETGGQAEHLIFWNPNENFASLGVGHFIWYPNGREQDFKETFPDLIRYLSTNGVDVPEWLQQQLQIGALWSDRAQLEQARETVKFRELQQLLLDTSALQVSFLFQRLDQALPAMLSAVDSPSRARITHRFNTLKQTPGGLYPLVDYVNFKGDGTAVSERYRGVGWGLLQVLETMDEVPAGPEALKAFSEAADTVLSRRVENAPADKNEYQWLPGWRVRLNSYY